MTDRLPWDVLACPGCHGRLEPLGEDVRCGECDTAYGRADGVIELVPRRLRVRVPLRRQRRRTRRLRVVRWQLGEDDSSSR